MDSRTGQGPMWQLAQFEDYVVNPNSIAPVTHPGPHILSKIDSIRICNMGVRL